MLANQILSSPDVLALAAEIARTKTAGEFQPLTVTLEELFLSRSLDLGTRGIPNTLKPSLVLDLYRLFAGYIDFRFATAMSVQSFYNTNANDWFAYYKVPTPNAALWHHISASENGILKGELTDKLIEAKQIIQETPSAYLSLLKDNLLDHS